MGDFPDHQSVQRIECSVIVDQLPETERSLLELTCNNVEFKRNHVGEKNVVESQRGQFRLLPANRSPDLEHFEAPRCSIVQSCPVAQCSEHIRVLCREEPAVSAGAIRTAVFPYQ